MKLWGGRFSQGLDPVANEYNASLPVDQRMAEVDVLGSIAWAKALGKCGLLTAGEVDQILSGLKNITDEIKTGRLVFQPADEDIHTVVERRLTELVGTVGGKLHTGRSRNDQVATDFRMWTLRAIEDVQVQLADLKRALVYRAEEDMDIILPGYTHTQRAQPILLSHWWLSHFWALVRDSDRFESVKRRTSVLPLGCGALAGTAFPIDRQLLADELGFETIAANSLDAIGDRDFATDFLYASSLLAVHLSQLSDAMILYCTAEYGFLELSDAYSTGSSLMPQKKNADMLELNRGKAGTMIGKLTGLLATLKGLPSAYDKDLQEDKEPVFDSYDILMHMLPVTTGVLMTLTVKLENIQKALDPAMLATDLADYLVLAGLPFREAHGLVGKAVRRAAELGTDLAHMPSSEYSAIHPTLGGDLSAVFDFNQSVARRSAEGGTSPIAVKEQLEKAKKLVLVI